MRKAVQILLRPGLRVRHGRVPSARARNILGPAPRRCKWRISVASPRRGGVRRASRRTWQPVERDHLGEPGSTAAPILRDISLHPRIDIGEGADCARDRAGGDVRPRRFKTAAIAGEFRISLGELQSEGHRLGVDAVAAADGRRIFVLLGAALQHGEQRVQIGEQYVRSSGELHREAGVEHVRAGHPLVKEARRRPGPLGDMGQEGDHVVLRLRLDRVDSGDVEGRRVPVRLPDRLGRLGRHHAQLGHRV